MDNRRFLKSCAALTNSLFEEVFYLLKRVRKSGSEGRLLAVTDSLE